jgi:aminopeptidase N
MYGYLPKESGKDLRHLKSLNQASGLETHGITVDYDVFENLQKPIQAAKSDKPSPVYYGVDLNFKLNPNGKAVDAGVIIPNVNDNFRGKAPDLGALELGSPAVIYGARGLKQDQEFWR